MKTSSKPRKAGFLNATTPDMTALHTSTRLRFRVEALVSWPPSIGRGRAGLLPCLAKFGRRRGRTSECQLNSRPRWPRGRHFGGWGSAQRPSGAALHSFCLSRRTNLYDLLRHKCTYLKANIIGVEVKNNKSQSRHLLFREGDSFKPATKSGFSSG